MYMYVYIARWNDKCFVLENHVQTCKQLKTRINRELKTL